MARFTTILLLGLVAACTPSSGGDGPAPAPQQTLVVTPTEPVLAAAVAEAFSQPGNPDSAILKFQNELARILADAPESAGTVAEDTVYSVIRTPSDLGALADINIAVDGDVFTGRFSGANGSNLAQSNLPALCPENNADAPLVVYYINGVNNTIFDALNARGELERRSGGVVDAEWRLFYNASGFRTDEDRCVTYGLILSSPGIRSGERARVRELARQYCSRTGLAADLAESIVQWATRNRGLTPEDARLVDRLQDLVTQDVVSGKKVIVVAHSQGNLYARELMTRLRALDAPDGRKPPRNAVGFIAVASPVTYESYLTREVASFRSVQLLGDVIGIIPGSPPINATNGHSAQVVQSLLDSVRGGVFVNAVSTLRSDLTTISRAVETHSFVGSYLGDSTSRDKIVSALSNAERTAVNGRLGAGQGFFQVTLTWDRAGDIDLHLFEPGGDHVYFSAKQGIVGELDRDDRSGTGPENYFVCSPARMVAGVYQVSVNNWAGRTGTRATIRIRAGNQFRTSIRTLGASNRGADLVPVARVRYSSDGTFVILSE